MDKTLKNRATQNIYDKVPYISHTIPQTNPATLRSIASLFGMKAPDINGSRVLELGCASGNNIISIASFFPGSDCIGIDLSPVQIEEGRKNIAKLGITNLKLEATSIMDIDDSYGKFDYIIVHGVFSWVPKEVQEKILKICSQNLTPEGLAYISYNTLPGWEGLRALREMMQYHAAKFEGLPQKAGQARALLQFIRDGLGNDTNNNYSDMINDEIERLENQPDFYLLHEYLEENNTPYYFHQFMEMAAKAGLQYVAETALYAMDISNLPAQTENILNNAEDIISTEQYLDFLYNRRFRSTILCHDDKIIDRNISLSTLDDKFFMPTFGAIEKNGEEVSFTGASGITLATNDKILIAALSVLSEQKIYVHISVLIKETIKELEANGIKINANEDRFKEFLSNALLKCIFTGIVAMSLYENNFTDEVI